MYEASLPVGKVAGVGVAGARVGLGLDSAAVAGVTSLGRNLTNLLRGAVEER